MNIKYCAATTLAIAFVLVIAGCTTPPPSQPVVINEPVDAFNAVGEPYTPNNGRYGGSLAGDVQRLQNARTLYHRARERQRNAVDRSQEKCLQQSDSRRVKVKGAMSSVVYCEPAVD